MASIDIITKYFPKLTETQQKQFAALVPLYEEWNEKINVISRKDIDNFLERHVLHSLAIAKVCQFKKGTEILDVGTGGGFPGIPLAIIFPETQFHLVDSIGKKIMVVEEVVKALGLKNVTAAHGRAEKVKDKFDFVLSRAVTRMKPFYNWVNQKIKPDSLHSIDNGILYLKGGDLNEEMDELKRPYSIKKISSFFDEPFFETKKVVHVPIF